MWCKTHRQIPSVLVNPRSFDRLVKRYKVAADDDDDAAGVHDKGMRVSPPIGEPANLLAATPSLCTTLDAG